MKIYFYLLSALVAVLLFTPSCQNGSADKRQDASQDGDIGSSADEKVLYLYTFRHLPADDSLFEHFRQLTGIRVDVVQKGAGELLPLLRAGGLQPPPNVVILPEVAMAVRAKEEGLLQLYHLPGIDQYVKAKMQDDYGYWTGLTIQLPVIAYASGRVEPKGLDSFFGLAETRWKGRLLAPGADDPYLQSLVASIIINNGEQAARKWARGVAANFARPPQGSGLDQLKALGAGQGDVAIANASDLGYLRFPATHAEYVLGQDTRLIIPFNGDYNHINATCAVVPKGADTYMAAQLIEFLTSSQAQQSYPAATHENPVNVMGIPSDFSIEEVGGIKEDPISLNQLAAYNQLAVQILRESGW
ncbi:MAG: extracellular solute-binding protein [Phaeodactylibacter sp.]|nr:extracellular solute-binding protein [Phaeodactylibacter sp.]